MSVSSDRVGCTNSSSALRGARLTGQASGPRVLSDTAAAHTPACCSAGGHATCPDVAPALTTAAVVNAAGSGCTGTTSTLASLTDAPGSRPCTSSRAPLSPVAGSRALTVLVACTTTA